MKSIYRIGITAIAASIALSAVPAIATTFSPVKEDTAQLNADKSALQRQLRRLEGDETRLKEDTASGRMSAESRDAYEVYQDQQAIRGEKKAIASDKAASLQMQSDKAALQRQIQGLEVAEARLKADTREGRMAAESRDSEKVYQDQQAIKGEKMDIAADRKNLKGDEGK